MNLDLEKVSLICIDPVEPDQAVKVLNHCRKEIDFGETILVSTRKPEGYKGKFFECPKTDWQAYNDLVLHMTKYIDNQFALLVQTDGFILNPDKFDRTWFYYDYIGAPWPSQSDWIALQTDRLKKSYNKDTRVGNGGFSFRSKKFMDLSDKFPSTAGLGEDTFLCVENYKHMVKAGIKFASVEDALQFSVENPIVEMGIADWRDTKNPKFNPSQSFGWHGKNVSNYQEIIKVLG